MALGATTHDERSQRAANLLEHGFRKLGWAQLFPTYSVESLPMEIEPKGPMTMRQTSPSWVCDAPAAAQGYRCHRACSGNIGPLAAVVSVLAEPRRQLAPSLRLAS